MAIIVAKRKTANEKINTVLLKVRVIEYNFHEFIKLVERDGGEGRGESWGVEDGERISGGREGVRIRINNATYDRN